MRVHGGCRGYETTHSLHSQGNILRDYGWHARGHATSLWLHLDKRTYLPVSSQHGQITFSDINLCLNGCVLPLSCHSRKVLDLQDQTPDPGHRSLTHDLEVRQSLTGHRGPSEWGLSPQEAASCSTTSLLDSRVTLTGKGPRMTTVQFPPRQTWWELRCGNELILGGWCVEIHTVYTRPCSVPSTAWFSLTTSPICTALDQVPSQLSIQSLRFCPLTRGKKPELAKWTALAQGHISSKRSRTKPNSPDPETELLTTRRCLSCSLHTGGLLATGWAQSQRAHLMSPGSTTQARPLWEKQASGGPTLPGDPCLGDLAGCNVGFLETHLTLVRCQLGWKLKA